MPVQVPASCRWCRFAAQAREDGCCATPPLDNRARRAEERGMCVCLVCDDVAVTPSITCRILERMTCVRVIPVLEERGVPIKQREVDHEGIGLGAPQSFARADRFAVALSAYDA